MTDRPASIRDVAERAGVSPATVSNVLNRPGLVSRTTVARVEDAISTLGFVRNESARRLGGGESRTVAYVVLDVSNPFFTDVARGVAAVMHERGLSLFLCDSAQDQRRESQYLDLLLEQRVRGVLITAQDYESARLRVLPSRGIPLVLVDCPPGLESTWCSVGVDDVHGGNIAATHLLEAGHARIGFVGGPLRFRQIIDRLRGARAAVASVLDASLVVFETSGTTFEDGRRAGARLLGLPRATRPTAVFCANDLLAIGLLQYLAQRRVGVPEQLSIVGYDDIEFASASTVPLTSVSQPRFQLGRAAAELLLNESTETAGDHTHQQLLFQPELVVRESSVRTPSSVREVFS
jgi:LacI family transcriptional regulator